MVFLCNRIDTRTKGSSESRGFFLVLSSLYSLSLPKSLLLAALVGNRSCSRSLVSAPVQSLKLYNLRYLQSGLCQETTHIVVAFDEER